MTTDLEAWLAGRIEAATDVVSRGTADDRILPDDAPHATVQIQGQHRGGGMWTMTMEVELSVPATPVYAPDTSRLAWAIHNAIAAFGDGELGGNDNQWELVGSPFCQMGNGTVEGERWVAKIHCVFGARRVAAS